MNFGFKIRRGSELQGFVEVWAGSHFVLTKGKIGSVSVTSLIKWYLRSLGDVGEDSYVFPVFRKGKAVETQAVSYCAARK